jgi:hypothetical protein
MDIVFTYDTVEHLVGNVRRFRESRAWFKHLTDPYNKCKRLSLDEAKDTTNFVVHEVYTERGPDYWLGLWHLEPNCPNIIELLPQWLLDKVRNKTAVLFYDQTVEGNPLTPYYTSLHNVLNYHNIPCSQIIYATGNLIENDLYTEYCNNNNVTDRINIVGMNYFAYTCSHDNIFNTEVSELSVVDHLKYKKLHDIKLFNSLNRVVREHRIAMNSLLNYYDLLDDNLVSQDVLPEIHSERFSPHYIPFSNHPAYERDNMISLNSKLPLVLDTNQFEINTANHFFAQVYLDSWVSLITETFCVEKINETVFFSEKIYKPIRARHSFILVGQYKALSKFKLLGFKTFGEFWDESYDDIEDDTLRLEKICMLLKDLAKLSKNDWVILYTQMKPVLEHNMRLLLSNNWTRPMNKLIESHEVLRKLS